MDINLNNLTFSVSNNEKNIFKCIAIIDNVQVCECQINVDISTWTISKWYTNKQYLHKGIGSRTIKHLLNHLYDTFGTPDNIEYIWNGANYYVYEWMEFHFGAISKCPISVQKTQSEDDWDSHVYYLNVQKVIEYLKA